MSEETNGRKLRLLIVDPDKDRAEKLDGLFGEIKTDLSMNTLTLEELDRPAFFYELSEISGLEISHSGGGPMAVTEMGDNSHDLYFIHHDQGEKSGRELLRAAGQAGCSSPMILLAERDDQGDYLKSLRAGAADFLLWDDLTPGQLERAIHRALERNRAMHALLSSQKLFRSVTEAAQCRIAIIDDDGHIVGINAQWNVPTIANPFFSRRLGVGNNYLKFCAKFAKELRQALEEVLNGERALFQFNYGEGQLWRFHAYKLQQGKADRLVVVHQLLMAHPDPARMPTEEPVFDEEE